MKQHFLEVQKRDQVLGSWPRVILPLCVYFILLVIGDAFFFCNSISGEHGFMVCI